MFSLVFSLIIELLDCKYNHLPFSYHSSFIILRHIAFFSCLSFFFNFFFLAFITFITWYIYTYNFQLNNPFPPPHLLLPTTHLSSSFPLPPTKSHCVLWHIHSFIYLLLAAEEKKCSISNRLDAARSFLFSLFSFFLYLYDGSYISWTAKCIIYLVVIERFQTMSACRYYLWAVIIIYSVPLAPSKDGDRNYDVVDCAPSSKFPFHKRYQGQPSQLTYRPDGLVAWFLVWIFGYTISKRSWVQFPVRPFFSLHFLRVPPYGESCMFHNRADSRFSPDHGCCL